MVNLNLYMHGYVVLPILDAFLKIGFFEQINKYNEFALEKLKCFEKANEGPLYVCLNVFEALCWIKKRGNFLIKKKEFPTPLSLPDISAYYLLSIEEICFGGKQFDTNKFIESLHIGHFLEEIQRKKIKDDLLLSFLDGLIILPLFYVIKQKFKENAAQTLFVAASEPSNYILKKFLLDKNLVIEENNTLVSTETFSYLISCIDNSGVTLSYRPLLSNIAEMVFGKWENINHEINADKHVERRLNVIGSGAQHQIFFDDILTLLKILLSDSNIKEVSIIDVGCGDGTLLKKCYDSLSNNKNLFLIGVDYNEASLIETERTLNGTPHKVIKGDVACPEKIIKNIATSLGGAFTKNALHLRTFLDHDRPYISPQIFDKSINKKNIPYAGFYPKTQLLSLRSL